MQPALEREVVGIVPPLSEWKAADASWKADGSVLETGVNQYGSIIYSPPIDLLAKRIYHFDLSLEFIGTGGVSFGLQDGEMGSWMVHVNVTTNDPAEGGVWTNSIRVCPKRSGRFRLVLANCLANGPGVTRIKNPQLTGYSMKRDQVTPEMWKEEARKQWNTDHCGHDRGEGHKKGSLEYFLSIERDRYESYAPWMPEVMGFRRYGGKKVLEIGGGLGTDLVQFAKSGAEVTDIDLAEGHLNLAKRNFDVRGMKGDFVLGDAEKLPLPEGTFDVVYSNGVIHHTPDTQAVVDDIFRILKPGGEAIVMVYAKHSWNYWVNDYCRLYWRHGLRKTMTMDEVLSAYTEWSPSGARPLVKVYTAAQCRRLFRRFSMVRIRKYQLTRGELPKFMLKLASVPKWGRIMGWNLVIKAIK